MSDTPETDSQATGTVGFYSCETVPASLARKLERQRDAFRDELSKVMPLDFKDWWQNSKEEWPLVARLVIESLREREAIWYDPAAMIADRTNNDETTETDE